MPLCRFAKLCRILVLGVILSLAGSADAKQPRHHSKGASSATKDEPKGRAAQLIGAFTTVVVDPGHGGHDVGGIPENFIPEKDVALDVARRVQTHLESAGLRVVMTRSDDTFISLGERVRIANAERDAIFLSIHFNSALRAEARGIEVYYGSATGEPLAKLIREKLLTVTVNPDDRPLKLGPFWVLRQTKCPAVLAECGFLTNCEDVGFALEDTSRETLAEQIAAAVIEYHQAYMLGN
jgi:N-acetylmuramoyl-L-alanine amidase